MAVAVLLAGPEAFADEPGAQPGEPPPEALRTEVGVLPVLSYDSDTGLMAGALVTAARFTPAAALHAWRLEAVLSASFKTGSAGLSLPLHDHSFALDVPGLSSGALRLGVEAHFRRYRDAGWYGPGGASSTEVPPSFPDSTGRYHRYTRLYPGTTVDTRWRLWERREGPGRQRLEALAGAQLDYNEVTVEAGSLLDEQLQLARSGAGPDAAVLGDVLRGIDPHLLGKLRLGMLYDTRDDEFQPTRGVFLELSARVAPAPASLRHVGFFTSAVGFLPLWGERLVLGARLFADALVGAPPFYALSEAGVVSPNCAPGGATTVRGVLLQRFAGKLKVVGGAELRAQLIRFSVGSQRFGLGVLVFADAGRAWADWHPVRLGDRDVDDPWTRFAFGAGGGLRVAWGKTLVIRADLAWSPTEGTRGLYIGVGHVF